MTPGDDKGGKAPQSVSGTELLATGRNDVHPRQIPPGSDAAIGDTQPCSIGAPSLLPAASGDSPVAGSEDFLSGGGEMGVMMRAKDWSSTPLGPTRGWPQSLRTCVSTCLSCSFPIAICWGPDFLLLYNDAYAEILADKRVMALGLPCAEVWPEIWDTIGPMLERARKQGKARPGQRPASHDEPTGLPRGVLLQLLLRPRSGTKLAGLAVSHCPVIETTQRVLSERRSKFLLELEERLRAFLSTRWKSKAPRARCWGGTSVRRKSVMPEVVNDGTEVWIDGDVDGREAFPA